jgi:hypothetical protein
MIVQQVLLSSFSQLHLRRGMRLEYPFYQSRSEFATLAVTFARIHVRPLSPTEDEFTSPTLHAVNFIPLIHFGQMVHLPM